MGVDLGRQGALLRVGQEGGLDALLGQGDQAGLVQVEQAGGDGVLRVEVGGEHRRVVGVQGDDDAGLDHGSDRVLVQVGHRSGGHVGGGADLQRDPMLGQVLEQAWVPTGGRAVADPFGPELGDRIPDRLRSGGLPGVRQTVQAGGPGAVEVGLELRAGHTDLGTAEAESDQRRGTVVQGDGRRALCPGNPFLTGDVEDPPQPDAVITFGRDTGVLDGLDEGLGGDAPLHRGVRSDGQFGVPDVLGGHVLRHLIGQQPDILGGPDQVHHRQVDVHEMGEVGEGEVGRQRLGVGGYRPRVPGRQLGHDPRRGRSDMVHVQLRLGQGRDEISGNHVSSLAHPAGIRVGP